MLLLLFTKAFVTFRLFCFVFCLFFFFENNRENDLAFRWYVTSYVVCMKRGVNSKRYVYYWVLTNKVEIWSRWAKVLELLQFLPLSLYLNPWHGSQSTVGGTNNDYILETIVCYTDYFYLLIHICIHICMYRYLMTMTLWNEIGFNPGQK